MLIYCAQLILNNTWHRRHSPDACATAWPARLFYLAVAIGSSQEKRIRVGALIGRPVKISFTWRTMQNNRTVNKNFVSLEILMKFLLFLQQWSIMMNYSPIFKLMSSYAFWLYSKILEIGYLLETGFRDIFRQPNGSLRSHGNCKCVWFQETFVFKSPVSLGYVCDVPATSPIMKQTFNLYITNPWKPHWLTKHRHTNAHVRVYPSSSPWRCYPWCTC